MAIVSVVGLLALNARPANRDESSQGVLPESTATVAAASATPKATQPAGGGDTATPLDVMRIVVPSLEIDAPIVTLGVDPDGTMQSPDNPVDVAWYNFSARPGEVGNVVMAGHLDYVNHGPAVFYRLKEARLGDEVRLVLGDGTLATYRVRDVTTYDEATAPVQEIVGPTENEVVTLITCGGSFDPLSREYDKRVVLRAERVQHNALVN